MRVKHEEILEKVCKEMIETIFMCLDHAKKGTVYLVGPLPELQVIRVTSGVRMPGGDEIQWGLPEKSDYNYPGKSWLQYRDEPSRALEAMAWCVEHQKSWTADNPYEDARSVRKQLMGEPEDCHHMEPVLLNKNEIYGKSLNVGDYPLTWEGMPIWQETEYVVVAVIKIHFIPNSIRRGDRSTKLIKQLSRRLGSELLSLHFRQFFHEARRHLDQMRIESCNALAHDLRNPIMKLGFISYAINTEIAFLREQWEDYIASNLPELHGKSEIVSKLNALLNSFRSLAGGPKMEELIQQLIASQNELKNGYWLPQKHLERMESKIIPLWEELIEYLEAGSFIAYDQKKLILDDLEKLRRSITFGIDEEVIGKVNHLPDEFKKKWVQVAYEEFVPGKIDLLDEIIQVIKEAPMEIPHGNHISKNIYYLKTLLEVAHELENRVTAIISELKNGRFTPGWLGKTGSDSSADYC